MDPYTVAVKEKLKDDDPEKRRTKLCLLIGGWMRHPAKVKDDELLEWLNTHKLWNLSEDRLYTMLQCEHCMAIAREARMN